MIDCNVAIKWYVPEAFSHIALRLLDRCEAGEVSFVAPESIVAETGHTLRRLLLGGKLTPQRSLEILHDFVAAPIVTVPLRPLAAEAMRLSAAHMGTYYDALYLALAEREDLRVVTADEGMVSAFARLDRTVSLATIE